MALFLGPLRGVGFFEPFNLHCEGVAQLSFTPATLISLDDSLILVKVEVDSVQDLFSFATDIYYSPAELRFVQASEGDFLSSNGATSTTFFAVADPVNGKVVIGVSRLGPTAGGVSTLEGRTLVFLTFAPARLDTTFLDFANTALFRSDGSTRIPFEANRCLIVNSQITGIEPLNTKSLEFRLLQNYPNPFNPRTRITYDVPISTYVRVSVYDQIGRQVAILIDGQQMPGSHDILFDGDRLSSGMYFVVMRAGKLAFTRRALLLK